MERIQETVFVKRPLICLATAGFGALKWCVREFLPFSRRPITPSGSLCRFIGCVVIVVVLRAELKDGLLPGAGAVIQLAVAGLTAILLGNVAKEFAFDLYARLVMWSGHAFVREGLTLAGNAYCEIQFGDGTWMRCEIQSAGAFCEWTEPGGRCKRIVYSRSGS